MRQREGLGVVLLLPLFLSIAGIVLWWFLDSYVFGYSGPNCAATLWDFIFSVPCPLIGSGAVSPGFVVFARAMTIVGFPAIIFLLLLRSYSNPSSSRSGRQIGARRA